MTPTARTLKQLREEGVEADVVERYQHRSRKRHDLFGMFDILYLDCLMGRIVAVQCTSASNHSARRKKLLAEPRLQQWLACNGGAEVWSWRKHTKAVEGRWWRARIEPIEATP